MLMTYLGLTVLAVFALLVGSEAWWRKRRPHDEFSRKFIHIFVGSFAAFWPFYLAWGWIVALSAAFVLGVILSKYFKVFQSIHAVERPTWGEVYFALAVGVLAFITHQPWVYAVALLHMSLADGLAAVAGVTWGKPTQYKVFGHAKSVIGSLTFFAVSLALLMFYQSMTGHALPVVAVLGIAAAATAVENLGVFGLDNLLIPIFIGLVLTRI